MMLDIRRKTMPKDMVGKSMRDYFSSESDKMIRAESGHNVYVNRTAKYVTIVITDTTGRLSSCVTLNEDNLKDIAWFLKPSA